MKTYILLKDLPDVKAGAKFEHGKGDGNEDYYLTSDKTRTGYNCYSYPKDFVENNKEWFEMELHEVEKKIIEIENFLSNSCDNVSMEIRHNAIIFNKGGHMYAFNAEYVFKKLAFPIE